jgi:hypothetical protein
LSFTLVFVAILTVVKTYIVATDLSKSPNFKAVSEISTLFPKCMSYDAFENVDYTSPCKISFLYSPTGEPYDSIMKGFAAVNIGEGAFGKEVVGKANRDEMLRYIYSHTNEVGFGIALDANLVTNVTSYKIFYNATATTLTSSYQPSGSTAVPEPMALLSLQHALEVAIISYTAGKAVDVAGAVKTWTTLSLTGGVTLVRTTTLLLFAGVIVVGPAIMSCGFVVFALVILNLIIREKDSDLLLSLRRIGLMESAHIGSWYMAVVIVAIITSIIAVIVGQLCGMQYFLNTDFAVNFVLFFLTLQCLGCLAIMISAFIKSSRWINITSFFLFFYGLIFNLMICTLVNTNILATAGNGVSIKR